MIDITHHDLFSNGDVPHAVSTQQPPTVLTIAGSDCGGGAGIQADLKTFATEPVYAAAVITGITAQNTQGVQGVYPCPQAWVKEQIASIASDLTVSAIKIGALFDADIVESVADACRDFYPTTPCVVDPVMVSTSGDVLLNTSALSLYPRLLRGAHIITPNVREALLLADCLGINISASFHESQQQQSHMLDLAVALAEVLDHPAVLLKGGDNTIDHAFDVLVLRDKTKSHAPWVAHQWSVAKVDTKNNHGTGCSFGAMITASLAQGYSVVDAVTRSKRFVFHGLQRARNWRIGQGCGSIDHAPLPAVPADAAFNPAPSDDTHTDTRADPDDLSRRGLLGLALGLGGVGALGSGVLGSRAFGSSRLSLAQIDSLMVDSHDSAGVARSSPSPSSSPCVITKSEVLTLRMVTSWPKDATGTGDVAQHLCDTIAQMSGGEINVDLYPAGTLVPALEVWAAVRSGVADMAHTASVFWQGRVPAAPFFTAIPFGMTPLAHDGWLRYGGGNQLWQALYRPYGLIPMAAGNTGANILGWFRQPLRRLDDVVGLKIRVAGLAAVLWQSMGAVPMTLGPGDIASALANGTIDAAEFAGIAADRSMGFGRYAKTIHVPGFHEPNGTAELIIKDQVWFDLTSPQQAIVAQAAQSVNDASIARANQTNARALVQARTIDGVIVLPVPDAIVVEAQAKMLNIISTNARVNSDFATIWESYRRYADDMNAYQHAMNLSGV